MTKLRVAEEAERAIQDEKEREERARKYWAWGFEDFLADLKQAYPEPPREYF